MILVVGGTGDLGGRVVRQLHQRGERVRCLVRAESDDSALRGEGVEIVRGDLTQPETLPAACDGVDTVVATATVIARRLAGARRPSIRRVDEIGMLALVDAAEQAGVRRFVYLSYAGTHVKLNVPIQRAKQACERRLGGSAMRTVIVRPDAFQEIHLTPTGRFDIAGHKVTVLGSGDTKIRWVGIDDVAGLVAGVTLETDPPGQVEFGGPEALSRNDAIALVEQLTGRTMRRRQLPRSAVRMAARALAPVNDARASVFGLGLLMDTVERTWDDTPLRKRGISPRSASAFLRSQVLASTGR